MRSGLIVSPQNLRIPAFRVEQYTGTQNKAEDSNRNTIVTWSVSRLDIWLLRTTEHALPEGTFGGDDSLLATSGKL